MFFLWSIHQHSPLKVQITSFSVTCLMSRQRSSRTQQILHHAPFSFQNVCIHILRYHIMLNRYDELANAPKRFETAHPCLNILRNNSNAWNVEVTEYAKQEAHHQRRTINAVISAPTNTSPHADAADRFVTRWHKGEAETVSYTHLTLPTICSV